MTSTFIVLSSIVKSPIKCLSFFPYRFISLAPPRSGSGSGSGERGGRCVPGPLGAAGTAPRTGLGCGTRAGHSIISAGPRGCLGGCLGAGSVALVPRCAAPPLWAAGSRRHLARVPGPESRRPRACAWGCAGACFTFISSSRARGRGPGRKRTVPCRPKPGAATGPEPHAGAAGGSPFPRPAHACGGGLGLASNPARPRRQGPGRARGSAQDGAGGAGLARSASCSSPGLARPAVPRQRRGRAVRLGPRGQRTAPATAAGVNPVTGPSAPLRSQGPGTRPCLAA